ncbi:MAG: winged helix-turn-helix transcriptional regulator [Armatimonadetes bacterium]|nr:winged helix-turn-helix transcriptional regulator [Armatimonadota bacterium]
MKVKAYGSPFGSLSRTRVLLALALLDSSYQRELARLLGVAPSVAQKALSGLERDGLVVGRLVGRTRVYALNPRYFALPELVAFLRRLAEADIDLRDRTAALRRRPRRAGKAL